VAASPEAKAEVAGATADNVEGTVPTVEPAVAGAPLTVGVAPLLPAAGTPPAVEAAVAGAPLTVGVTPDIDGTVTGATVTAGAVGTTVAAFTVDPGALGGIPTLGVALLLVLGAPTTPAAMVVAAVVTGTAVVSVPETTEAALLLTASATTWTKEPVSLVISEMLVSPFEPKSTVWVELTSRTCWSPRVRSMASGVLAKRMLLFDDARPSRMVLVTCRLTTIKLRLQHGKYC